MGNDSSSSSGGNDSSSSWNYDSHPHVMSYDYSSSSSSSSSSNDRSGANDDRPSNSSSSWNYTSHPHVMSYDYKPTSSSSNSSSDRSGANDRHISKSDTNYTSHPHVMSYDYNKSSTTAISTPQKTALDTIGSSYAARYNTYAANASIGKQTINAGAKAASNAASVVGKTVFESGYHNINTRTMESQSTNKFIREQVTVDRVITGVGVATDIASKSVGSLASTAATMAIASQNDKFSQRSTAEQRIDTTVGAIGAGAGVMAMAGIGATIAAPIALGAGGGLAAKECAKMIHNLDNIAINNINNHIKNDSEDRKALLDLHDKVRIPH